MKRSWANIAYKNKHRIIGPISFCFYSFYGQIIMFARLKKQWLSKRCSLKVLLVERLWKHSIQKFMNNLMVRCLNFMHLAFVQSFKVYLMQFFRWIGTSYPKIATNFKSFYLAEIFALLSWNLSWWMI